MITIVENCQFLRRSKRSLLEPNQGDEIAAIDHFDNLERSTEISGLFELEGFDRIDFEAFIGGEGHA